MIDTPFCISSLGGDHVEINSTGQPRSPRPIPRPKWPLTVVEMIRKRIVVESDTSPTDLLLDYILVASGITTLASVTWLDVARSLLIYTSSIEWTTHS